MDPLVHIHIVNLSEMFVTVGNCLKEEDKYTKEGHQIEFEKELKKPWIRIDRRISKHVEKRLL